MLLTKTNTLTMSNQIKQIQAHYLPIEDRILLKIHTDDQQVFHAWLTRRYLKLLLPALQGQHPQTGETLFSENAQTEVVQPVPLDDSQFNQPYEPPEVADFPLGETPILLSKITFKGFDTDAPQLALEPEEGSGIALSYQPSFVKALLTIIQQSVAKADWQFDSFIHQAPEIGTLQ
ncbi:hypothetical protein HVMH_2267 [Hydrogenovibrio marinus]|nr:hypothetical protein HVMH_2267 [Hydrogenovibrio marinus]